MVENIDKINLDRHEYFNGDSSIHEIFNYDKSFQCFKTSLTESGFFQVAPLADLTAPQAQQFTAERRKVRPKAN